VYDAMFPNSPAASASSGVPVCSIENLVPLSHDVEPLPSSPTRRQVYSRVRDIINTIRTCIALPVDLPEAPFTIQALSVQALAQQLLVVARHICRIPSSRDTVPLSPGIISMGPEGDLKALMLRVSPPHAFDLCVILKLFFSCSYIQENLLCSVERGRFSGPSVISTGSGIDATAVSQAVSMVAKRQSLWDVNAYGNYGHIPVINLDPLLIAADVLDDYRTVGYLIGSNIMWFKQALLLDFWLAALLILRERLFHLSYAEIAELDPPFATLMEPWFQLDANSPLPTDMRHPVNQLLIDQLNIAVSF